MFCLGVIFDDVLIVFPFQHLEFLLVRLHPKTQSFLSLHPFANQFLPPSTSSSSSSSSSFFFFFFFFFFSSSHSSSSFSFSSSLQEA
nr:unnamed protein product [Spirometra erinaceieuropaei]